MAFFIHDGKVFPDMWPNNLARFPNGSDEASTLSEPRLLPSAYEYLCERPQVLAVHSELEPGKSATRLYVRLQGIVGQVSLTPRGNWNGEAEDAAKALQSLTLVDLYPGCEDSAFPRQREGVHNLEELVLNQVYGRRGDKKPARVARNGAINLRKRAFTMAKPKVVGIKLATADDPDGKIKTLGPLSVVDHRIRTFIPNWKGRVCPVSPQAIRPGDMVDGAVTLEVVRRRGPGGGFMIMFCPTHVVKLKSVEGVRTAMMSPNVNIHESLASIDPRPRPTERPIV